MADTETAKSLNLHFTAQYREKVMLGNGRLVSLRVLRASDQKKYLRGFEQTSDRSRTLRYLKPRPHLERAEVEILVTPHNEERLGIGVFERRLFGFDGNLLASAHLSRDPNEHDHAEFVIGAIDEAQRFGLGRLLMRRLSEAAVERNIRFLTFTMLSRNDAARQLFASPPWNGTFERHGETTTGVIDLLPGTASDGSDLDETDDSSGRHRGSIKAMIMRRRNRKASGG